MIILSKALTPDYDSWAEVGNDEKKNVSSLKNRGLRNGNGNGSEMASQTLHCRHIHHMQKRYFESGGPYNGQYREALKPS